jgi:phosphatidylglycerol:prolipoprotein diacylglycerol transferase
LGTASTGDVLVYPLLLGSVVGRLGCSCSAVIDGMVGIPLPATWQAVAPYWGALVVNTSTVQHVSTKVTQLLHMNQGWAWNVASIEIVGLVVIALALRVVQQHYPLKTGQLFYSFCLGYFMLRLGLDELKQIAPVLTVVQWFSVVGIVWSVYRLWYGCYVRTEESKN